MIVLIIIIVAKLLQKIYNKLLIYFNEYISSIIVFTLGSITLFTSIFYYYIKVVNYLKGGN